MHGYWMRHRLHAPVPQFRKALVGYIILFVARMSFRTGYVCFWASFSLCEGQNCRYLCPATSFSLLACLPCSVTRRNSSNGEEHWSARIPAGRLRQVLS